jgi:carbon-monoxide dehydrogenase medium subunit
MDIAVAGAAVSVSVDENGTCTAARVAVAAVAPTPLVVEEAADALIGTALDEEALEKAGAAASAAARPIDDKRGPADYRRRVVGVLTRRAAANAAARAKELD